jgi:hypothetical protein
MAFSFDHASACCLLDLVFCVVCLMACLPLVKRGVLMGLTIEALMVLAAVVWLGVFLAFRESRFLAIVIMVVCLYLFFHFFHVIV